MVAPLDYTLKLLDEEFEALAKLFPTKDWKMFKFGLGGPHKRVLQRLTHMAHEYDAIIIERFGLNKEIATFRRLVGLGLRNDDTYKELYKHVDTFRRQIKRQRGELDV